MNGRERNSSASSIASRVLITGACMAAVAAVMYLMDPNAGRRRRALIRDKAVHAGKRVQRTGQRILHRSQQRLQGLAAQARGAMTEEQVNDEQLRERVRAALGHATRNAGSIHVDVFEGCVVLYGPVLADEVGHIRSAVNSVRGVRELEDHLQIHQSREGVPGLQE